MSLCCLLKSIRVCLQYSNIYCLRYFLNFFSPVSISIYLSFTSSFLFTRTPLEFFLVLSLKVSEVI